MLPAIAKAYSLNPGLERSGLGQFALNNATKLFVIYPEYKKVVPTDNDKTLTVAVSDFVQAIERVITVSLDRKEGVKLDINKDNVQLSVNSANSGEGNEKIKAEFSSANLSISFNSKYLTDIASEVDDKDLKMNLKDSVSPVLIEDASDKNSYYVIMPMKI